METVECHKSISTIVSNSLNTLITMLNDPDKHVRNTSSWCIERVAELFPEVLVSDNNLQVFIECFITNLKSSNKIIVHLCNAIHYLSSSLKPHEDQVSCMN